MIDGRALVSAILDAVEAGVTASLEQIKDEAQRRAPVRRLFRGGGRRRFVSGQIGVRNQLGSGRAYFRTQNIGRTLEGRPIVGRTNSSAPVTAPRRGSGIRAIGDIEFREVRGGKFFRARGAVGREILSRAKSEARRGKGLHVLPGGKAGVEYGGTLRDSIEVVGPERKGNSVVGFVRASAIEHGFNYAYAQEFGTAHNAPQPFLRPALRSMFRKIAVTQRDSIRNRLERAPVRMKIVSTGMTIEVTPERSSALARFDSRMARAGLRLR